MPRSPSQETELHELSRHNPHRPGRALISASGSYLRWVAAKRASGREGAHAVEEAIAEPKRECVSMRIRCVWLLRRILRHQSAITRSRNTPKPVRASNQRHPHPAKHMRGDFRPWSSSSIFWRSWVTGTSFSATQLTSIPHQLPILEHAVASAAPAASYKSPLRALTHSGLAVLWMRPDRAELNTWVAFRM